jgi:dipeptidyl aminopeptidase/acylaminoacyl peptidase
LTQPQVLVYDADTQKLQNLGSGWNPTWNADSDRVAFGRDGFGAQQLVVVTLATGQEERLGLGSGAAWLPDGKRIAVIRDGNIWLLAYPAGGADTQLTHYPTDRDNGWTIIQLAYHYSGRILFYGGPNKTLGAQGNGLHLYAADLRNGEVKELTPPGGNVLVALDISPDGRYVAVADQAHSSACASYGAVTVVDMIAGTSLMLPLPAAEARHAHVMGVSWAPQPPGRLALAYNEFQCTGDQPGDLGPSRVYLMDMPNIKALREEAVGAWPAWNRGREGLGLAPGPGSLFSSVQR